MKKLLQKLPLGAMLLSLLFTLYAIAGWARGINALSGCAASLIVAATSADRCGGK